MKYFFILFMILFVLVLIAKNIDVYFQVSNYFFPCAYGGDWELSVGENPESLFYTSSLAKDDLIKINVLIENESYWFVLDTGSSDSTIKSTIARKTGFYKKGTTPFFYGGNLFRVISLPKIVLNKEIRIGPFVSRDIEWHMMEDTDSEVFQYFDGIIGVNILKNFLVDLNFSAGEVKLYLNDGKEVYSHYSQELAISDSSMIALVCDGKKRKAMIDTGDNGFVDKYDIGFPVLFFKKEHTSVESYLVKGRKKEIFEITDTRLEIGEYSVECTLFRNVSLKNLFSYKDIVLGIKFLSYSNWLFDFKHNRVYLESYE